MIKLIVSDFDGTLMPYGTQVLSQNVKDKIKTALDKNITVAISSGRTYKELLNYLSDFSDKLYFICCDGAYYMKNGKPLYEKRIENSDIAFFFNIADSSFSFILHGAQNNYSFGSLPPQAARFNAVPVLRANEIKEKIFKITSFGNQIKLPPFSGLRTHWDGGSNFSAQYVNRFANKGTALSDLQTRLILTKFDTACIGDSQNDIPMMHNAKYSFSVGFRSEELSAITGYNVDSVESALDFCLN